MPSTSAIRTTARSMAMPHRSGGRHDACRYPHHPWRADSLRADHSVGGTASRRRRPLRRIPAFRQRRGPAPGATCRRARTDPAGGNRRAAAGTGPGRCRRGRAAVGAARLSGGGRTGAMPSAPERPLAARWPGDTIIAVTGRGEGMSPAGPLPYLSRLAAGWNGRPVRHHEPANSMECRGSVMRVSSAARSCRCRPHGRCLQSAAGQACCPHHGSRRDAIGDHRRHRRVDTAFMHRDTVALAAFYAPDAMWLLRQASPRHGIHP